MNFIGASILIVLISVVFCASRRTALLGMMAGVLYVTQGQQIQVLGLHLFADRFLELAGFIRVMARREFVFSQLNRIDFAVLLLYCYTTVVFLLRSSDGMAYQLGVAVDAFLCYFAFRGLMANIEDLEWFLRGFLMLLAPYTLLVLFESFTRHNLFSAMGAVADGTWGAWQPDPLLWQLSAARYAWHVCREFLSLIHRLGLHSPGTKARYFWGTPLLGNNLGR